MSCDLSLVVPGEAPGSLGFMSPEAMVKDVPDPTKTDVWAIACVLLELVKSPMKHALHHTAQTLIFCATSSQAMGQEWFENGWLEVYKLHRGVQLIHSLSQAHTNQHYYSCTHTNIHNCI